MTSKFLSALRYEDLDGSNWRLREPLEYMSTIANGVIVVPAGFVTDLASIPRFFHRVCPKSGPHNYAAVVHDYMYRNNGVVCIHRVTGERVAAGFSKRMCDDIFLEGMRVKRQVRIDGRQFTAATAAWRRFVMHRAVLYFAGSAWREHERRNKGAVADPCGCLGVHQWL